MPGPVNEGLWGRIKCEDHPDARMVKRLEILIGNDAVADGDDIAGLSPSQQFHDTEKQIAVGAEEAAQSNEIHILLYRAGVSLLCRWLRSLHTIDPGE